MSEQGFNAIELIHFNSHLQLTQINFHQCACVVKPLITFVKRDLGAEVSLSDLGA